MMTNSLYGAMGIPAQMMGYQPISVKANSTYSTAYGIGTTKSLSYRMAVSDSGKEE